MALPEFEQELDLPAGAGEDERLLGGQQGQRDVGDQDGPVRPSQARLADRFAASLGLGLQLATPGGAASSGTRTASRRAGRCWPTPSVTGWSMVLAGVAACCRSQAM